MCLAKGFDCGLSLWGARLGLRVKGRLYALALKAYKVSRFRVQRQEKKVHGSGFGPSGLSFRVLVVWPGRVDYCF